MFYDAIRNDRERIGANLANIQTLSPVQGKYLQQNISAITESTHTVNTVVARLAPGANLQEVQERISRWNHFKPISDSEQTAILAKGMIEKARMQLGLFRVILLVISAVIISLIIYTSTLDKIKVIATLKLNRTLRFVFASLALLFFLLALGDITGNKSITILAGYEGIVCGFSAIYLAAAEILNGVYKKTVLPM